MSKPDLRKCAKILIVEGYSDLCFYAEFLQHLGRYENVFIQDMKGRARLEDEFMLFFTPKLLAEKSHIAIALDADDDGPRLVARLQNRLRQITHRELTEGEWSEGAPKLGFFVAPSPDAIGEIEDLVWLAWAEHAANADAVRCVDQFISCMEPAHPSPQHGRIAKRRLGSLLSIRHEDDPRLGPAAQARKIDFDAPAFARLREFLNGF
jgi:5S rRNA maturation endonuclease (ribonuclease M5)